MHRRSRKGEDLLQLCVHMSSDTPCIASDKETFVAFGRPGGAVDFTICDGYYHDFLTKRLAKEGCNDDGYVDCSCLPMYILPVRSMT